MFCEGTDEFPDVENRDGPRNVGLLAVQPPEAVASPGRRRTYFDVPHRKT
jgi:hypothetical protein